MNYGQPLLCQKMNKMNKIIDKLYYNIDKIFNSELNQENIQISARDNKLILNFIDLTYYFDRVEPTDKFLNFNNMSESTFISFINQNEEILTKYHEIIEILKIDFNVYRNIQNEIYNKYISNKHTDIYIYHSHSLAQFMLYFFDILDLEYKLKINNQGFKILKSDIQLLKIVNQFILSEDFNPIYYKLNELKKHQNVEQILNELKNDSNFKFIITCFGLDENHNDILNKLLIFNNYAQNYLNNKIYNIDYLIHPDDYNIIKTLAEYNLIQIEEGKKINRVTILHFDYLHFKAIKKLINNTVEISEAESTEKALEDLYNKYNFKFPSITFKDYNMFFWDIKYRMREERKYIEKIYPEHDLRTYNIIEVLSKYQSMKNPDFKFEDIDGQYFHATNYALSYLDSVRSILDSSQDILDTILDSSQDINFDMIHILTSINENYRILLKYFISSSSGELLNDEKTQKRIITFFKEIKEIK